VRLTLEAFGRTLRLEFFKPEEDGDNGSDPGDCITNESVSTHINPLECESRPFGFD
jgi:hypothetical protein